jgi:transcriptional regulator with XRE-family HTH domain
MTFAEKIRKRMVELKMSQTELAEGLGTNQPQVSAWLNQGVMPSTTYAVKVAKLLGLSLDYLLDDTVDDPPDHLQEIEKVLLMVARDVGISTVLREFASGRFQLSGNIPRPARGEISREVVTEAEKQLEALKNLMHSKRLLVDILIQETYYADMLHHRVNREMDELGAEIGRQEQALELLRENADRLVNFKALRKIGDDELSPMERLNLESVIGASHPQVGRSRGSSPVPPSKSSPKKPGKAGESSK